jgi:hypothetical protein
MRDMHITKFESCCRYAGFNPVPEHKVFVSQDGLLRVPAVLEKHAVNGSRINRRASLKLLLAARKEVDSPAAKSEATGASTPMASVTQPDKG